MRFFLELVERRYDRASTVLCSQYPVSDWHPRLGGGTHADAILDRVVHHGRLVEFGGPSHRLEESLMLGRRGR